MAELTSQQKKTYLQRYRRVIQRIARKQQELAEWRGRADIKAMVYTDMPKAKATSNALEMAVEGIEQKEREVAELIAEEVTELARLRDQIQQAIESVEDETLRLLLEYKYIDGLSFEQIAVKMCYTFRHVTRLHGKALNAVTV